MRVSSREIFSSEPALKSRSGWITGMVRFLLMLVIGEAVTSAQRPERMAVNSNADFISTGADTVRKAVESSHEKKYICGKIKNPTLLGVGVFELTGRLPSLPHTRACSTIGAEGLNFRVRDGNGWDPLAKVTQKLIFGSRNTPTLL